MQRVGVRYIIPDPPTSPSLISLNGFCGRKAQTFQDQGLTLNSPCTFFFNNCIVPMGFLPRENRVALLGESQLRQSRATQPRVHAGCFSVSIVQRTLTWATGSLMCAQMSMRAIAPGVYGHRKRVCTESWHWKKIPFRGDPWSKNEFLNNYSLTTVLSRKGKLFVAAFSYSSVHQPVLMKLPLVEPESVIGLHL